MTDQRAEQIRVARETTERVFSFLVDEYGYAPDPAEQPRLGFALRYLGPGVGIIVDWEAGEALTVWLVRLVDDAFPNMVPMLPGNTLLHFDLRYLERYRGFDRDADDEKHLLDLPDERSAQYLADRLRRHGAAVLAGDLDVLSHLQPLILDRAKGVVTHLYGEDEAHRLGF